MVVPLWSMFYNGKHEERSGEYQAQRVLMVWEVMMFAQQLFILLHVYEPAHLLII